MYQKIATFLVHHRGVVLTLLALITPVAAAISFPIGDWGIQYNFTPQALFAGGDQMIADAEEFKEIFEHEDNVIVIVLETVAEDDGAKPTGRDALTAEALRWQTQLSLRASKMPDVVRVQSIATLRLPRISFRRTTIRPVVRSLKIDDEEAARIREIVQQQRLLRGTLVSEDASCASIALYIAPDKRDVTALREIVQNVEQLLTEIPPPDGYRVHVSGLPTIRVDIVDDLKADLFYSIPLTTLLFFLLMCFIFRSLSGIVLPGLAVFTGLAWMLAVLVLTDHSLNILTNVLPQFLLIVGTSNCVHVVSRFAEDAARLGDDKPKQIALHTTEHMAMACLLTSLTTAIGFLSLLVARSHVLNDFGWQAAMGMGLFYVSIISVFGTLMPSFRAPRLATHYADNGKPRLTARVAAYLGSLAARRPWLMMCGSLMIVAAALLASRNVVIDSQLIETYEPDHPVVRTMRLLENKLGGFLPLEVSLKADRPGRLLEPATLTRVLAAEDYASQREQVVFSRSYVDFYRAVDRQLPGTKRLQGEIVEDSPETIKRIGNIEENLQQYAKQIYYNAFLTPDGRHGRLLLRVRELGSRRGKMLIDDLEAKFAELFPDGCGVQVQLTGDMYVGTLAIDNFIHDLFFSLMGASVAIFAVVGLLFRSIRVGLISIIPNMTPLLVTLGYMGLRGYSMNTGNVIVFAISLGIAVDDTVHFIARFREEIVRDQNVRAAIHRTCLGAGRAIVITSFLLVAGLSVLYTSDFVPTRRFAELTSVAMIAALLGDLLLLPACLAVFWKVRER